MAQIDWATIAKEALGDFTLKNLPPTLSLPALPHAVTLFVQKSEDPDCAPEVLAKILSTDAGLTFELLRHVNSAFFGCRQKAGNVLQALTILGQKQSKMFVVTKGMQAAVQARKSKLINQGSFWNASLQKALFAREVAQLLKTDLDLAFAGALLQDYLLPVISNELFDVYLNFLGSRQEQPVRLCEFERQQFGWDHPLAAACLASRWHLPDDLVCCILFHHSGLNILNHAQLGRSPAAAVALSALLPDQLRQHDGGLDQLLKLQTKWSAFDLTALAARVDELHEQSSLGMRNDFPLARRVKAALEGTNLPAERGMLAAARK